MNEIIDMSVVNWSRGQFALTAIYHWLFVPLTIGLGFIIAFMESIYFKTGNEEWKRMTKFWMTLFGINFAIGVATGLILEFQFGTNWSNYSWFVGDIFGAPLAIEGIMAFFLESTFIAVMFFGWNKVSKSFHLLSTWLVAFGSTLSALWILVANAWMQYPVGMHFNPDTARNEMVDFWQILFSPVAINKFLHSISAGFVLASIFVLGISAWFILHKRDVPLFKKSMLVACVFGLITSVFIIITGDISAKYVAQYQPMKLASMEGLYKGANGANLKAIGIVSTEKYDTSLFELPKIKYTVEIPKLLSFLAFNNTSSFVPGIKDLISGNTEKHILSLNEKIERGTVAQNKLALLQKARNDKDTVAYLLLKKEFMDASFQNNYFAYFGYAFITSPKQVIPHISLTFYSFHIMVILGFFFVFLFVLTLYFLFKSNIVSKGWLLWILLLSIPLPYIAGEAGWIVSEVGRQPWVIQDYLPTFAAISKIDVTSVKITFFLFAILFSALLVAEIKIMLKQIKLGPKEH
jgi:cytochrome d ubiquinol oxidase subunit I